MYYDKSNYQCSFRFTKSIINSKIKSKIKKYNNESIYKKYNKVYKVQLSKNTVVK